MYLQGGSFYNEQNNNNKENKNQPDQLKKMVLVLMFALGALMTFAQDTVSVECLKVKVKPTIDNKPATGVTIRLYKGEQELTRIDSTEEKSTEFVLEKNANYTIEIVSPGRQMRRVSFFTSLPGDVSVKPMFRYYMDVELPAISLTKDDFYLDFPIAVVSYNEGKDKFEHSKQYTAHIRQRMDEVKTEKTMVTK